MCLSWVKRDLTGILYAWSNIWKNENTLTVITQYVKNKLYDFQACWNTLKSTSVIWVYQSVNSYLIKRKELRCIFQVIDVLRHLDHPESTRLSVRLTAKVISTCEKEDNKILRNSLILLNACYHAVVFVRLAGLSPAPTPRPAITVSRRT